MLDDESNFENDNKIIIIIISEIIINYIIKYQS